MERTLLTLTPANVVTVTICGLLGYGILIGVHRLFGHAKRMSGMGAEAEPAAPSGMAGGIDAANMDDM